MHSLLERYGPPTFTSDYAACLQLMSSGTLSSEGTLGIIEGWLEFLRGRDSAIRFLQACTPDFDEFSDRDEAIAYLEAQQQDVTDNWLSAAAVTRLAWFLPELREACRADTVFRREELADWKRADPELYANYLAYHDSERRPGS